MEEKKQELVIKITNRVIEVKLEDGTSPGLFLFCHYLNDNTFDNVKEMDDFIKFLAKVLRYAQRAGQNALCSFHRRRRGLCPGPSRQGLLLQRNGEENVVIF